MVWVKICGITEKEDAEAAAGMGADCLGFILSTDSPRCIEPDDVIRITGSLKDVEKAGVFVNEDIRKVTDTAESLGLDYVQLSGDEDVPYIKELRRGAEKVKIIKALRIKKDENTDIGRASEEMLRHADFILLDSYDKYMYGGTGKTVDWKAIKGLIDPDKLIVSGGLCHENVSGALDVLEPFGVDASSRLEASPGKKDHDKVRKFLEAVRSFKVQDKENNDG